MVNPRRSYLPGLLVTGLLHIAIIYAFMQRQHMADTPRAHREEIQWLLPMARPAIEPPRQPQSKPQTKPAPQPIATPPLRAVAPPKAADAPAAQPDPQPPAAALPDDPFAQAPASQRPQSASDILNQAKLDVGKIDKELRASYRQRPPEPPPDSKQARLERGISAAHDAVPPKWYQGARIVELSTPDGENKTRTYKIITAVGEYCIHIRPDGRKSYTLCPK
ncbi:hypothetical protein [Duganella sp. HH101]|uniref:hypothetical protein n=1 Tax=Duganella sp. HH101 TaxID=1781066 RepID=UPI000892FB19|nr:hypothetical protein [Duganella sp. HH101]OFA06449.1 hypothetical protein DUGA2_09890 [Duganella sp. HH101]